MLLRNTSRFALRSNKLYASKVPRFFSQTALRFNESKPTLDDKSSSNDVPKKRELSRIAIGSQSSSKKYAKSTSIEFAAWKAVVLFIGVGGVMTYFFNQEKERLRLQKEVESKRSYGKPLIGGPFDLIDTEGKQFTHKNLLSDDRRFSIIYFGFTHCPDICPDELDKLGEMLEELKSKDNITLQPIFITCDPARDTPEVIKEYLTDFHSSIIGLTGSYENVKKACKQYRVYFSTPPDVKPGQDYLVDHSIFFYLMDSEGNFVDVIGKEVDATQGAEKIRKHVDAFLPEAEREKRKSGWLSFLYK
ncbi:protein Sco1p, mitochondrial [[Candida] railenensis]|uniref:Protein Sco1p, mitochondrial n=1 Tax=[Candida] railenensis TaxID=45579 RepID=A0A9P0VVP9_9ASCO|nr:protein Sco1p, mitochondrial [[Candida] railenensis]